MKPVRIYCCIEFWLYPTLQWVTPAPEENCIAEAMEEKRIKKNCYGYLDSGWLKSYVYKGRAQDQILP